MQNSGEVLSLWVGSQSQQLAHHFYALQAEQFFDESQDPINHNCLWKLYDKHGQRKNPYFLTFDTQIPHLNYIRKVNHGRIIKEMQKNTMKLQEYYFPMQYKTVDQNQQPQQKDKYLFDRWEATEDNYSLIDKNFIQDVPSFDFWKEIFKLKQDKYEDDIRKKLQKFDYLKSFTLTSDQQKAGFTHDIMTYLREQCPKTNLVFVELNSKDQKGLYELGQLCSLAELGPMADTYFSIDFHKPKYSYFDSQNLFAIYAPLLNCLMTPLSLKQSSKETYMNSVLVNPRRNIFDIAYTLPIIDSDLFISRTTNISDYLLQGKNQTYFQKRYADDKEQKQQNLDQKQQKHQPLFNRINYTKNFLHLNPEDDDPKKKQINLGKGVLAQSYIMKGHFKDFQKIYEPNSQLFDIKYLEGILANYKGNGISYAKPYVKTYGQNVQNYPFHCVAFQHQNFNFELRKIAQQKTKKAKHELQSEWRQNLLLQADLYKQKIQEDSD